MLKMREVVVADETVRKSISNEETSLSKEPCPQGQKFTKKRIETILAFPRQRDQKKKNFFHLHCNVILNSPAQIQVIKSL